MKKIILLILLLIIMSSCFNPITSSFSSESEISLSSEEESSLLNSSDSSSYINSINVDEINNLEYEIKKYDAYSMEDYATNLKVDYFNSIGENAMLVIPLLFEDTIMEEDLLNAIIKDIDDAFFGNSEDTYWESVSSYYKKSSYNQVTLKGEVTMPVRIDKTVKEVAELTYSTNPYKSDDNRYYDNSFYPLAYAYSYLKDKMDLTKFDLDKDGYLDSVYIIYLENTYSNYLYQNNILINDPSYDKIKELLWAYTYWYKKEPNINNPVPFSYVFASYKFMYDSYSFSNKVDAHTYIHETGHVFGLKDYYNYDYGNKNETINKYDFTMPSGGLDMMDLNIGDHNSYSKFLLGWIKPKIVKSSGKYYMSPFQNEGDVLLIPYQKDNNNSSFDEYLLIEFYTPSSLNKLDSSFSYMNKYPTLFKKCGFKVYHVDSRIGLINQEEEIYYDDFSFPTTLKVVRSNTPSMNNLSSLSKARAFYERLITLVSPLGNHLDFYDGVDRLKFATNNDLFTEGTCLERFAFHQGEKDIKITFSNVSENGGYVIVEV